MLDTKYCNDYVCRVCIIEMPENRIYCTCCNSFISRLFDNVICTCLSILMQTTHRWKFQEKADTCNRWFVSLTTQDVFDFKYLC